MNMYVLGGDDSARYYISYLWQSNYLKYSSIDKILNPDIDWLPLQFYITGIIMKFTDNDSCILLVHAIISVISIYFFYKIAYLLSNSKSIAKLCAIVLLIYPAHIEVSSRLLSEPFYSLALFGSVYYLLAYIKESKDSYLIYYSVFTSAAVILRFEGWFIAFWGGVFIIAHLYKNITLKRIFLIKIPLIIISLLLLDNYLKGFGSLRFIETSDDQVSYFYTTFGYSYSTFINFYPSWLPFTFVFFLISIFVFKTKIYRLYLLLVLLQVIPFVNKAYNFTVAADYRYIIFYYSFFIIPFVMITVRMVHNFSKFKKNIIIFTLITIIILPTTPMLLFKGNPFKNDPNKEDFESMIYYVNQISEGNFFIDNFPILKNYYAVAKMKLTPVLNYEDKFLEEHFDFKSINDQVKEEKLSRILSFWVTYVPEVRYGVQPSIESVNTALISSSKPIYLLLHKDGELSRLLNFGENKNPFFGEKKFNKIFQSGPYYIYKEIPKK